MGPGNEDPRTSARHALCTASEVSEGRHEWERRQGEVRSQGANPAAPPRELTLLPLGALHAGAPTWHSAACPERAACQIFLLPADHNDVQNRNQEMHTLHLYRQGCIGVSSSVDWQAPRCSAHATGGVDGCTDVSLACQPLNPLRPQCIYTDENCVQAGWHGNGGPGGANERQWQASSAIASAQLAFRGGSAEGSKGLPACGEGRVQVSNEKAQGSGGGRG